MKDLQLPSNCFVGDCDADHADAIDEHLEAEFVAGLSAAEPADLAAQLPAVPQPHAFVDTDLCAGSFQVEHHPNPKDNCLMTVRHTPPGSDKATIIGTLELHIGSGGKESLIAQCRIARHKRCKCWVSTVGHQNELVS